MSKDTDWRRAATAAGWIDPTKVPTGLTAIWFERNRQQYDEGWHPAHDDNYRRGELAGAAACYALLCLHISSTELESRVSLLIRDLWPWSSNWWKPRMTRENLARAGALIAAEIERLDRAAQKRKN